VVVLMVEDVVILPQGPQLQQEWARGRRRGGAAQHLQEFRAEVVMGASFHAKKSRPSIHTYLVNVLIREQHMH